MSVSKIENFIATIEATRCEVDSLDETGIGWANHLIKIGRIKLVSRPGFLNVFLAVDDFNKKCSCAICSELLEESTWGNTRDDLILQPEKLKWASQ